MEYLKDIAGADREFEIARLNKKLRVTLSFYVKISRLNRIMKVVSESDAARKGDYVIVETDRGDNLAVVISNPKREILNTEEFKKCVRILSGGEYNGTIGRDEAKREDIRRIFLEKVSYLKIEMKLVTVDIIRNDNKIVFYFTADGRVDFRELVKELAQSLKSRIEMRQIGVRDESRICGGIGPCGKELCCSTFLKDFMPVTIKMAKTQGLILNPQKLSGLCGRLMCCLSYENQLYEELKKDIPTPGSIVRTPDGEGKIVEYNLLKRTVKVELGEEVVHEYGAHQVKVISKKDEAKPDDEEIEKELKDLE